jgi:hypothetical protein
MPVKRRATIARETPEQRRLRMEADEQLRDTMQRAGVTTERTDARREKTLSRFRLALREWDAAAAEQRQEWAESIMKGRPLGVGGGREMFAVIRFVEMEERKAAKARARRKAKRASRPRVVRATALPRATFMRPLRVSAADVTPASTPPRAKQRSHRVGVVAYMTEDGRITPAGKE